MQNTAQQPPQQPKKSGCGAVLIIIIALLIIGVLGFVISRLFSDKSKPKPDSYSPPADTEVTISDTYRSVNKTYSGSVDVDEIPEYIDALYQATDSLVSDGTIVYREKQDTCVYVEDKSGVGTFLSAPNDQLSAGGGSLSFISYQPFYSDFSSKNVYNNLTDDTVSKFSSLDLLTRSPVVYKDSELTVQKAMEFNPNSVILWDGHGMYSDETGSCLALSYKETSSIYNEDYKKGRLCYCLNGDEELTVLTPEFFDYCYSNIGLENSVIFLGACRSAYDTISPDCTADRKLTEVLRSKGASAVFASSETIYTYYCHQMEYGVLTSMAQGSSASSALTEAKSQYGANDYTPSFSDNKANAEVLLFGDGDCTLQSDYVYTNTQFNWSVTVPKEWFTYGTIIDRGDIPEADQYGSVFFYHKQIHEETQRGFIFAIIAIPVDSSRNDGVNGGTGSGGYLGTNGSYAFYYFRATDVQADPYAADFQQRLKELEELNSMRNTILSTFRLQ